MLKIKVSCVEGGLIHFIHYATTHNGMYDFKQIYLGKSERQNFEFTNQESGENERAIMSEFENFSFY